MALAARTPVTDAYRLGHAILLGDRQARVRRYPHVGSRADGPRASAHLPVHTADGRRTGVVAVARPWAVDLDEETVTTLTTIAELTGQALERADLHDTEHDLIGALQARLIGPVPSVPGFDVAARYIPATSAGIGGDWYEAVPYRGGSVLVIGDVTGHGVDAVSAMAQLSAVIGGLVRAGEPLGSVFARASAMFAADGHRFATAQLFHVDPAGTAVEYLSAGHPWALLRRADGTVEALDGGRQPLIGTRLQPTALASTELEPGALLLAYTDGLVERRDEPLNAGMDRLADRLAGLDPTRPLDDLLDDLLRSTSASDAPALPEDDVAALLLRRRPGAAR
jgi:serine phosphatase RsbU (regulator of sigma subunit)